jgi:hypothetical protein
MHIRLEVKTNSFISLYIKYVTGFNDEEYGPKCLTGNYSKLIAYGSYNKCVVAEGELNEYDAPYMYICGTTRLHMNDLHMAFKKHESNVIEYDNGLVRVKIEGAEKLEIPGIKEALFPIEKAFNEHFMFGYHYLREGANSV